MQKYNNNSRIINASRVGLVGMNGVARSSAVLISEDRLLGSAIGWLLKTKLGFSCVREYLYVSEIDCGFSDPVPEIVIVVAAVLHGDANRKLHRLRARFGPNTRIAIIATSLYTVNFDNWPVDAILDDRVDQDNLIDALKGAMRGERIVMLSKPCRETINEWDRIAFLLKRLRPRTRQVLDLLASGYSGAQISNLLEISEATVKWNINAVLRVLGLTNRVHAVAIIARMRERSLI